MYTLEVEIALDTGRPMCIRNSDIDVEWPIEIDDDVFSFLSFINIRTLLLIRISWSCRLDRPRFRI
jgi:hypothetical protein